MAYQTIATKYRPQVFNDLIGQEPVSLALIGTIAQSRIPSGVIFSGTRGVGKTSVARIYAKALNCDDSSSPEACGKCESCTAISLGTHEDVIEIDGASNNGVDEVRALKETMVYVPQRSRYRIYIIDEVHMLSMSAFNALLKTLEEPPSYTVFLFATTEIGKVPQTVLSRCQTFHLHKISLKDISARIGFILSKEGVTWEDGLLPFLAKEGRGSLRDALTFLDQLIAISGSHLTKASLEKIVGSLSSDNLSFLRSSDLKLGDPRIISNKNAITKLVVYYLMNEKNKKNRPINDVCRFHLGNGAIIDDIIINANVSEVGFKRSFGVMVNYLYELKNIEKNHEDYINNKKIIFSDKLKKFV